MSDAKKSASLSAEDLQRLLRPSLNRLGITTPPIEECRELVIWTGPRPTGPIERPQYISDKPHRYLTALKSSLAEVEGFYRLVLEHAERNAGNEHEAGLLRASADDAAFLPLQRLHKAIEECAPLCAQNPQPYRESWEFSATALSMVFDWIVARSRSNAKVGLSKGGPKTAFVCSALESQGWRKGNVPSEDAVLQFLKRNRRKEDK